MKWVMVTGGSRSLSRDARRTAGMLGTGLAQAGFGLVTGSWPGVDALVSAAFGHELARQGRKEAEAFRQVVVPRWKRNPFGGYVPRDTACSIQAATRSDALEKKIALSDAGVIVAGLGGAQRTAERFLDQHKPIFPLPATGGGALDVYQQILKTWHDTPVPGVTRNQFLKLSLPWIGGTGPLRDLLLGALSDSCDIFISYRRSDSDAAAGRLHQNFADHFGSRRVFMDVDNLEPSDKWEDSIEKALEDCRVGIIVIGRDWMTANSETKRPRLWDDGDFVRREIAVLLEKGTPVIPLLVHGGQLPEAESLPPDLQPLVRFQAQIVNNATWDPVIEELARICRNLLADTRPIAGHQPRLETSREPTQSR